MDDRWRQGLCQRLLGRSCGFVNLTRRHTHRVAIANSPRRARRRQSRLHPERLRQDGNTKTMMREADEFIRRFPRHTVPDGFHRTRRIGFPANCHRATKPRSAAICPPHRCHR